MTIKATTPWAISGPDIEAESNLELKLRGTAVNEIGPVYTLFYKWGNTVDGEFVVSSTAPGVEVVINLGNGNWYSGPHTGVLPTDQVVAFATWLNTVRPQVEAMADAFVGSLGVL